MSYLNYSTIQLLNIPSYTFTANCIDQTLSFTVTWSERAKKRAITVRGGNGEVYLMSSFLSVDEPLAFNINALNDNFPCSIVLQLVPDMPTDLDYLNWADNMFLTVYKVTEE